MNLEKFKLFISSLQSVCDDVVQNLIAIKDTFLVQYFSRLRIAFNLQNEEQVS